MRKYAAFLLFFLAILGLAMNVAEAARFGGGRSFGMQRSIGRFSPQPNRAYSQAAPRSNWAAPLAGLAIGSLLGYLLMGHGIASGLFSWFLILSVGLLIWNFLSTRLKMSARGAQREQFKGARVFEASSYFTQTNHYASAKPVNAYPAGFDSEAFLREAKVKFIRLQAAYDAKNLKDLREFTTPEVFAEIQMQLKERGDQPNHTEVVSLHADLLDASSEGQIATVKFSGVLREEEDMPASFEEVWHFQKDAPHGLWVVAGVQQEQPH